MFGEVKACTIWCQFLGHPVGVSLDPNWVMAALLTDLPQLPTCECLILFRTMLFVCVWMSSEHLLHQAYVWKQTNLHCNLDGRNSHYSIV